MFMQLLIYYYDLIKKEKIRTLLLNRRMYRFCLQGASPVTDWRKRAQLSQKIGQLGVEGKSSIAFVIGGSLGLGDKVLDRADFKLSFSRMTFPHQLMQMILLEQIYRGYRILNHEPYHK